jgi:ATP-dependent 26S proteasome regulatory subunit
LPPELTGSSPEKIQRRIDFFCASNNLRAMHGEASTLVEKLKLMEQNTLELTRHQDALRTELEAILAPEHYTVTITGVERNGSVAAEVAGLGHPRVQVGVHPDVSPETLSVGATGIVCRERNCLLRVTSPYARWKDIGVFERYIDSHRILIRDRETLVAVNLAHALRDTSLQKGDLIGYDRDVSGIAFQRLETPPGDHLFDENVTDDFEQLGGLDDVVARIKRHIEFRLLYPQLAQKYALKSKCGILLQGLPGNGKTRLARCCAGYIRRIFPDKPCRFMHVAGSSDYNMWFGETERRIIERFNAVREAAKDGMVVMFWDEVDAIAPCRGTDFGSGAGDRVLNTLLSQIDGVVPLSNVMLLYATNRVDRLDPGLLRAGRTDEKIEIPSPNRQTAKAILQCYLGQGLPLAARHDSADELIAPLLSRLFTPNGQFAEVAHVKLSDGRRLPVAGRQLLSGAMLENVVSVAAQQAAEREANTGQEGVSEEDLALVMESEMTGAVSLLAPANVKSYVKTIPQDAKPIAVEPTLITSATYTR